MEFRTIKGMVLSTHQDLLSKTSYLKVLTATNCQSIKLGALKEDYKYGYLLNPCYLLTMELVKTRKNWVLKSVIATQEVFVAKSFEGHQKLADYIHYLDSQLLENQQTETLSLVLESFEEINFTKSSIKDLCLKIDTVLGFA